MPDNDRRIDDDVYIALDILHDIDGRNDDEYDNKYILDKLIVARKHLSAAIDLLDNDIIFRACNHLDAALHGQLTGEANTTSDKVKQPQTPEEWKEWGKWTP